MADECCAMIASCHEEAKRLVAVSFVLAMLFSARGQAGRLDPTFRPVFGGRVFATDIQPDGKILVCGLFTNVNGAWASGIVRLNDNGSIDPSFQCFPGDYPKVVFVTKTGQVMIKGSFTTVNGAPRERMARLNVDGTLDESFNSDFRFNTYANFAFQSDGRILVDGFEGLYRLNSDGKSDDSFAATLDEWGFIDTIVVLPDDRILICGDFFYVNGVRRNMVALLLPNGAVDPTFNSASVPLYDEMTSLIPLSNGKVIVAGSDFTRLNADGTWDSSFPFYDGSTRYEHSIALQSDGKIVAGGYFQSRDGIYYRTNISRYLPDGQTDPTFDPGFGTQGGNWVIREVKLQRDHRILIGGAFTHYDGVPQAYLARVLNDWPVLEQRARGNGQIQLSWPAAYTNFVLQTASSLPGTNWLAVTNSPVVISNMNYVTNSTTSGNQFFRLVRP